MGIGILTALINNTSVPTTMSTRREPFGTKVARLIKENPLITFGKYQDPPVKPSVSSEFRISRAGITGTAVCLGGALYTFKRHQHMACQVSLAGQ